MKFFLQICLFVTTLIYYTDSAPRKSWGSFAQLLENNIPEQCTYGTCIHWAECKVFADESSRFKECSDKHGGPWVCCLDVTGAALEHSKTKDKSMIIIDESERLNIPTNNDSMIKSEIKRHEVTVQNYSSASILDKPEENVLMSEHQHVLHLPKNLSSTTKNSQNEVVIVPLDKNDEHLSMNSSLAVESRGIEHRNVDNNGTYITRNSSILRNTQNETSLVSIDENGDGYPNNASTVSKSTQSEVRTVTDDNIYLLDSSSVKTGNETSDTSYLPIPESHVRYPIRSEWVEVYGIVNINHPNSRYFSRRRSGKTSPPPRRISTWNYWNDDYDLNSQHGSTSYRDVKTTPRSWGRATTPSRKVTKESWGNGVTPAYKTTKRWRNPNPQPRNKPHTTSSESVLSRKPTTKFPGQNLTPNSDKRSTAIRKPTTIDRSWVKPTRQPDYRHAPNPVNKIMNTGEHRVSYHPRRKPAPWNHNTTEPSWSISTGMWSGRNKSTSTTKVTYPLLKSTTVSPKRTTTSRSSVTKSTINPRRTSTPKPTESNTVRGINIPMCGVRQDVNTVTSRLGRSVYPEHHPDSVTIYPNSRNNSRERSFQRIVGGTEAEPFTWPWVAALYKVTSTGGNRFLSAGSLINENFVLTAAHVFTPEDLRSASFVVMLGTHTAKEAVAEYPVMSVLRHPQYQQRFYYNDIALLRLAKPVVFNNYVMPVCLPSYLMTDDDLIGTRVTVMGWGDQSYGGITSRVLKEATFPIVSRQTCNSSYIRVASNRFPKGITTNMLCAGAPDGGKDACQGDSGGPLTTTRNGRHILLGIVSFGYRCGDKDYPGVYTRVASYLNWIAENANRNERHDHYDDYHARGR